MSSYNSNNATASLSMFALGAASALVAVATYQRWQTCNSSSSSRSVVASKKMTNDNVNDNNSKTEKPIWDSPDLDLRLLRKAEAVIQWRTTGLTVVVERCTNDHNYSAILRTAEALGVQNVMIIDPAARFNHTEIDDTNPTIIDSKGKKVQRSPEEMAAQQQHKLFAQNATEFLTITEYPTTRECLQALRATGHDIWATDLSQEAVPLIPEVLQEQAPSQMSQSASSPSSNGIPDKLAIVFGTEAVGCSQEMLQACDLRVYLPLRGYADSLNLSVATALVLHHLFLLKPDFIGLATEEERRELRRAWFPKLASQRLLSSREKKERGRLQSQIAKCHAMQAKLDAASNEDKQHILNYDQLQKLQSLPELQARLAEIEAKLSNASQAMQDWIENPPQPLTDLRRPDSHRITFVGKSTKKLHKDHWKDMAAVANASSTQNSTASFFRNQVEKTSSTSTEK